MASEFTEELKTIIGEKSDLIQRWYSQVTGTNLRTADALECIPTYSAHVKFNSDSGRAVDIKPTTGYFQASGTGAGSGKNISLYPFNFEYAGRSHQQLLIRDPIISIEKSDDEPLELKVLINSGEIVPTEPPEDVLAFYLFDIRWPDAKPIASELLAGCLFSSLYSQLSEDNREAYNPRLAKEYMALQAMLSNSSSPFPLVAWPVKLTSHEIVISLPQIAQIDLHKYALPQLHQTLLLSSIQEIKNDVLCSEPGKKGVFHLKCKSRFGVNTSNILIKKVAIQDQNFNWLNLSLEHKDFNIEINPADNEIIFFLSDDHATTSLLNITFYLVSERNQPIFELEQSEAQNKALKPKWIANTSIAAQSLDEVNVTLTDMCSLSVSNVKDDWPNNLSLTTVRQMLRTMKFLSPSAWLDIDDIRIEPGAFEGEDAIEWRTIVRLRQEGKTNMTAHVTALQTWLENVFNELAILGFKYVVKIESDA